MWFLEIREPFCCRVWVPEGHGVVFEMFLLDIPPSLNFLEVAEALLHISK